MCGIVGFTGKENASPFLCKGLEKLEYRGYDSAGIALSVKGGFKVIKTSKRIEKLKSVVALEKSRSHTGIGHTRWATHGAATKQNAHPHLSEDGKFAVVHNGIIENYEILKEELISEGFTFKSQTDTEVIPMLLQKYYSGDIKEAVFKTIKRLEGSYALGILCSDCPDLLIAARFFSPLIIGLGENANTIASDITAFSSEINKIIPLKDGEIAFISHDKLEMMDSNFKSIEPVLLELRSEESSADKEDYDHYMMKEIKEQPKVIEDTINCYIRNNNAVFHHLNPDELTNINNIQIIACGSAYHAGMVAKYFFEEVLKIPVSADIASEYRYKKQIADRHTLAIAISQSGETADTIAAITKAKESGAKTLSVVNVKNSTLSKITDYVLYTLAGPEIAVATTKGYTTQLAVLYILGVWLAEIKKTVCEKEISDIISEIKRLPRIIEESMKTEKTLKKTAKTISEAQSVFFIGRNVDYAVALEGSLKLKEISYIHSESYPAGELKHGTLSLVEKDTPIIALCAFTRLKNKTESNIKEAAARGGNIIKFSPDIGTSTENDIKIPETHPLLCAMTEIVPLQLLAYYTALYKGCDIDKPRNLAKSVTVE